MDDEIIPFETTPEPSEIKRFFKVKEQVTRYYWRVPGYEDIMVDLPNPKVGLSRDELRKEYQLLTNPTMAEQRAMRESVHIPNGRVVQTLRNSEVINDVVMTLFMTVCCATRRILVDDSDPKRIKYQCVMLWSIVYAFDHKYKKDILLNMIQLQTSIKRSNLSAYNHSYSYSYINEIQPGDEIDHIFIPMMQHHHNVYLYHVKFIMLLDLICYNVQPGGKINNELVFIQLLKYVGYQKGDLDDDVTTFINRTRWFTQHGNKSVIDNLFSLIHNDMETKNRLFTLCCCENTSKNELQLNIVEHHPDTQITLGTAITQILHEVSGRVLFLQKVSYARKNGKLVDFFRTVLKNEGGPISAIANQVRPYRYMILGYKKTQLKGPDGKETAETAIVTLDLTDSDIAVYDKRDGKCRANRARVLRIQKVKIVPSMSKKKKIQHDDDDDEHYDSNSRDPYVAVLGDLVDKSYSFHDSTFCYVSGQEVKANNFADDPGNDCQAGIHFFFSIALACSYMSQESGKIHVVETKGKFFSPDFSKLTFEKSEGTQFDVLYDYMKDDPEGLVKMLNTHPMVSKSELSSQEIAKEAMDDNYRTEEEKEEGATSTNSTSEISDYLDINLMFA